MLENHIKTVRIVLIKVARWMPSVFCGGSIYN